MLCWLILPILTVRDTYCRISIRSCIIVVGFVVADFCYLPSFSLAWSRPWERLHLHCQAFHQNIKVGSFVPSSKTNGKWGIIVPGNVATTLLSISYHSYQKFVWSQTSVCDPSPAQRGLCSRQIKNGGGRCTFGRFTDRIHGIFSARKLTSGEKTRPIGRHNNGS